MLHDDGPVGSSASSGADLHSNVVSVLNVTACQKSAFPCLPSVLALGIPYEKLVVQKQTDGTALLFVMP